MKYTHTFAAHLCKHTQHFSRCGHNSSFTILIYMADADFTSVSFSGRALEFSQARHGCYTLSATPLGGGSKGRKLHFIWVKFTLALLSWNFRSVSFVAKRKIKLIPCKWNKDDFDWSLKNQVEKLTGLTACHARFRETAGRCFSSYLHIKTSSQVLQIIQQINAALFNWPLITSAAGAY